MHVFLMTMHAMVCVVLIVVVLLQHGKGADMGAVLGGGGGNTVFGSRGAGNFLTKLTTGCAILFMVTSLSLSYLRTQDEAGILFEEGYVEPAAETGGLGAEEGEAPAAADELEEVSADELEEIPMPVPQEADPAAME